MHLERRGGLFQALDRRVRLAGSDVVQDEVAMRERAALGVLAGQANRDALDEQAREGELLRLAPVDPALAERRAPALELAGELRMDGEAFRGLEQLVVQLAEPACSDGGHDVGVRSRRDPALISDGRHALAESRLEPLVRVFQGLLDPRGQLGRLLLAERAGDDELLGVLLAHARLRLDPGGHQRLRVGGLVLLVVAVTPVTDQVDHDVGAEAAAERHRQTDRPDGGLRVVGVDVEDRYVEPLREVARVAGRAAVRGVGGEANLVVRDQMKRAAGRVAMQVCEVERLGDNALGRERRVAMDQDRHRDRRVVVARPAGAVGLLGPRAALDDRVDSLEVARVGRERDRNLA